MGKADRTAGQVGVWQECALVGMRCNQVTPQGQKGSQDFLKGMFSWNQAGSVLGKLGTPVLPSRSPETLALGSREGRDREGEAGSSSVLGGAPRGYRVAGRTPGPGQET